MATFKDNQGKEWSLSLDAFAIKQCRADAGVDLVDIEDGRVFDKLADPVALVDSLWVLCRKQAAAATPTIGQEDFAARLTGDAYAAASDAMGEAIADFFPNHRRKLLRAVMDKAATLRQLGTETVLQKITDPQVDQFLTQQLNENIDAALKKLTPSNSVLNSPVLLESRPPA